MNAHAVIGLILAVWAGVHWSQTVNGQPRGNRGADVHTAHVEQGRPHTRASQINDDNRSPIRFRPVVICDTFVAGYQVATADLNGDGRLDILSLGEHPGTVDWFENPGQADTPWPRRPISGTLTRRNIDLAVYDVNRDGQLDVAVASDFDLGSSDQGGTVSWLHRGTAGGREWAAVRIHADPTAHRIRWADIDGDRREELITVPIVGKGAKSPALQDPPARLTCHWIPGDPAHDTWPEQIVDQSLSVVHGVFVIDWNGDGRDDLLTASNQGVHLFTAEGTGLGARWSRRPLAVGHVGEPPNRGCSEVCVGRARNGARFLATIEPWHGNEVVVYTPPPNGTDAPVLWQRKVIDDSLRAGHALCCADLDGDDQDEIIAGYRGEGTSLYGYRLAPRPTNRWERWVIDAGGIAAQGCVASDVNGDGRVDLVATGGSTHNVNPSVA